MDKIALNTALKINKILTAEKISSLEKDLSQQKSPIAWEDFLLEKKIVDEKTNKISNFKCRSG
jgi:hypothetical protein